MTTEIKNRVDEVITVYGKEYRKKTYWYENGQKSSERNYKDGELEGKETEWYENGQKESELNYKDGELEAKETF